MTAHVKLDHVSKTYRHDGQGVTAVDDLSFEILPGEFVGYAGPNGAGKSTSIKALTGLLAVTTGEVQVLGVDPLRHRQQLARHVRTVFGQRNQMLWELSPADYYGMLRALHRQSPAGWGQRLKRLTEMLDLGGFVNQPVRTLSLGQRMRCEFVGALLPGPEILFLDEPTIGLDVEAKAAIREVLHELNTQEETTIILTTHDLSDIEALCSRLIIIDHGRLAYDGSIDQLFQTYSSARTVEFEINREAAVKIPPPWTSEFSHGVLRVTFDRQETGAARVIETVLAQTEVVDLRILEPDIEDVIRTIYREH